MHQFSRALSAVIDRESVGTFDGDEFGNGRGSLYMHGPDAERLFASIAPLLESWPFLKGGSVTKRYGDADSERVTY